jgi:hypothetical protein
MKNILALAVTIISLLSIAGCGKAQQSNSTSTSSAEHALQKVLDPDTQPPHNFAYYVAHLDEAKKTWDQCLKLSPEAITEQVRLRCDMAHSAWSTQPYKATPPAFSSSGGRH